MIKIKPKPNARDLTRPLAKCPCCAYTFYVDRKDVLVKPLAKQ